MNIRRVDPDDAQSLLETNSASVYLDVRTPVEFERGHVPGAVNVPVAVSGATGMTPNPDFIDECNARFSKDTPLIVGCLRGGRSLRAAGALIGEGFTDVVDMRGGWDGEVDAAGTVTFPGWSRRGLPVAR